jgi:tetratricopeptide (TPR) repeat protein
LADGTSVSQTCKYKAFISYSHADEKWAAWLHNALETYRVPKRLIGEATPLGAVPARLTPIFRDREELSTATRLDDVLTQALADSACLVVICSPNAARSRWTNEEILTFKRLGRSHRIFCLIVDGEPGASQDGHTGMECFPPALLYEIGADGNLTNRRSEPIAADARKGKDGRQLARLKLIAGMLGIGFDALRQREHHRQQRRMLAISAAAISGMAITSVLAAAAWFARVEAEEQRGQAEQKAEIARQTTEFMVGLFKVSDPGEALGNTITAREILDKGASRIGAELVDQPAIQATLMDTMGTVYTSLGLYAPALELVQQALERRSQLFGDGDPELAQSRMHLGRILTLNARYDEAEAALRQSLAARRSQFGVGSAEVAETATALADVLSRKGDTDAARDLIVEALEARRALHEGPQADVAESLEDLGLSYYEQGAYEKAVPFLREALAMRRTIHGDLAPELAESVNNLAWAVLDLGELEEAEALLKEALAMKRTLLEAPHPELAIGLNNIGYVLELRGQLDEAEENYRAALAMDREALPPEHPETATVLSNLAFVLYAKGDKGEAIEQLRQCLEMRRKGLGPGHPAVAGSATSLGFWLMLEGRYAEAERLLDEGLAIRRAVLGDEHPETAGTMTVSANLMIETGRYRPGLELARQAERILAENLPAGHWRIAAAQNIEGAALAGIGEYAQAEPLLLTSLAGLENAPIPRLAEDGRRRIAQLYTAWGRPEKAQEYSSMP